MIDSGNISDNGAGSSCSSSFLGKPEGTGLPKGGSSDSVPTLGHTHTLSPHSGRGAALPFPESNRVVRKLAFQIHPTSFSFSCYWHGIKQTNNSAWSPNSLLQGLKKKKNFSFPNKNNFNRLYRKKLNSIIQELTNQTSALTLSANHGSSNYWWPCGFPGPDNG